MLAELRVNDPYRKRAKMPDDEIKIDALPFWRRPLKVGPLSNSALITMVVAPIALATAYASGWDPTEVAKCATAIFVSYPACKLIGRAVMAIV